MNRVVTYGLGGYDPSKPNDNIVSIKDVPDDFGDNADAQQIDEDTGSNLTAKE